MRHLSLTAEDMADLIDGATINVPLNDNEEVSVAAPEGVNQNWTLTWPVSDEDKAHYADWRNEVADGDTVLGFRAWLKNKEPDL